MVFSVALLLNTIFYALNVCFIEHLQYPLYQKQSSTPHQ